MDIKSLKILVVGGGAIGGISAALLKNASYNVEIAVRDTGYSTLISEKGISIRGICGDHTIKIPAFASIPDIKEQKDVILLATKATDMKEAASAVKPFLKDNGYLVSLQNGICEDDLADVAGKNRIIGCVTGWGATMEEHGKLIMTSEGDFIIGYPGREPDEFLNNLAHVLSSVVPVSVTNNISGHKYSKLIINSCITSLGAICGFYLGEMLSVRKIRRIFIEIIREAVAVAEKMNIKIEVFSGRLDFKKFVNDDGAFADMKRHIMIRIIGLKYRKLKSSSLQSLERGQPTEVNFLNGYIVRNGEALGIGTPVNSAIVRIIHEIEAGEREISLNNFSEPVFDRFN